MQRGGKGLVRGVGAALAVLAVGVFLVTREVPAPPAAPGLTVAALLGTVEGGEQGYARALQPRAFHFPEDHGPHEEFRTEWWYWTGNLQTADGHAFGYQLTLFRNALAPTAPERASEWGTRQLYMGHFALSDIGAGRFHVFERFSRAALGLAGAQAQPFRVWLEDWEVKALGAGALPARLSVAAQGVALALELDEGKPPVLQGDRGLSQKGGPGKASYYYSLTRMPSRGTVTVQGRAYAVTGLSWMDREWSTSVLETSQIGWDWFSLQLSDGTELMYYQLRQSQGAQARLSAGSFVLPDGSAVQLKPDEGRLQVLDTWKSPRSGVTYPARWRLSVPSQQLELELTPAQADQELPVVVLYWEGAVTFTGTRAGQPVTGRGYVELTGYGDAPEASASRPP
ncbi:Predicted secreted hydrolase [Stigmatella aurantiaca]|uniref:Predicted secreted hydrolase n=1 Tax=Stigmatella aurantiaca TaxID=41 RepID=A0A1H7P4B9_STIAU|nr:lipocalin-like domain-containing protein [Stigmatella aurantiaca]SEL30294.1 Predicted secreted hydrolase [Stigmatella aurantiaca]